MSRYIDADKLLDYLESQIASCENTAMICCLRALTVEIDDQPTEFDVNKVIKQLEELKEWEDVDGKAYYTMSEKQVINKAIKIVKRGGINDN